MLRKTLQGSQSEEMVVTSETPTLVPFGDVVRMSPRQRARTNYFSFGGYEIQLILLSGD